MATLGHTGNIHAPADPSGRRLRHLDFDLNTEPPPSYNNEQEGGPTIYSSMVDGQQGTWIWVPDFPYYDRASVRSPSDLHVELQGECWPMNPHYYYLKYYDLNAFDHGPIVYDLDLNQYYGYVVNNDEVERGPTNSVAQVGQPNVLVAPVEQPQGSPPHGPIEVAGLDSYDEPEDNGFWDVDWDVDIDIDDDLAISSQTTQWIDSDSLQIADNHQRNVRRVESQPQVNIRDLSVHLGGTESSMQPKPVASPPLGTPQQPTFECPICMKPLLEQMATSCGHMFCEGCIKTAIAVQPKCPVCRRKVALRELRKIYFS